MKQILVAMMMVSAVGAGAYAFSPVQQTPAITQQTISGSVLEKNQVFPLKGFVSIDQCAQADCYDA